MLYYSKTNITMEIVVLKPLFQLSILISRVLLAEMDVNTILRYFEERKLLYSSYNGDLLLQSLNVNEFIYREERRSDLFLKRVDHVCMSENLKVAMVRETAYKQL